MSSSVDLLKLFGLSPIIELARVEYKNGALFIAVPGAVRDKLKLKDERRLIIFSDGDYVVLVKDSRVAELIRPQIVAAREARTKLKGIEDQGKGEIAEGETSTKENVGYENGKSK